MDAEEKMQPDDLGEAVAIAAASRSCLLVVHLGDPGKAHNSPGFNKMAEERDRLFIEKLMDRNGLADDINGVEGIEPSTSPGSSQIAGTEQEHSLATASRAGKIPRGLAVSQTPTLRVSDGRRDQGPTSGPRSFSGYVGNAMGLGFGRGRYTL